MLSEKHFSLEGVPEAPTKEKRFAYSVYMDMLVLMIKVAHAVEHRGGVRPLDETRFIKRLKSEETIKSLLAKYRLTAFPYEGMVDVIADRVKESAVYKNFQKSLKEDPNGGKETVWGEIYDTMIYPDPRIAEITSKREGFTVKGAERSSDMVRETFADFLSSQEGGSEAVELLRKSLDKARELYFRLIWLPVELTDMQERKLDERRHRHLVSHEDLNPNLKFVDNSLVREIRNCEAVASYIEKNKLSWTQDDRVMVEGLLRQVTESEIYAEYMDSPERSIKEDAEFWRNILKKVVFPNEHFLEAMEDQSVFWNDDLEIIGTFVLKTLRRLEEGDGSNAVLSKFKDDEDARFGEELVRAVLKNREKYRAMIDEAIDNTLWETERLAFMDVVIIETALAEILNFPKIPLTVSLNEYIEIAKSYSTAKSGSFVNGILAKIIRNLQDSGQLFKK